MSSNRGFKTWFEEQQSLGERCGVSLGRQDEELMEAAWNAGRDAIEIHLAPPHTDYGKYSDREVEGAAKYFEQAKKAIENAGLRVKA